MSTPEEQLEMLKLEAETLGISFSNNIGYNTLLQRVNEKKAQIKNEEDNLNEPDDEQIQAELAAQREAYLKKQAEQSAATTPVDPKISLRQKLRQEATRLVRLRITNLDPKKADLQGEYITVANEYIGTITKYVLYGEPTHIHGYHVPHCIYEFMRDRKFLNIRVRKRNGREFIENFEVPEYALEILPQLTQEELDKLAAKQAAAGGLDD